MKKIRFFCLIFLSLLRHHDIEISVARRGCPWERRADFHLCSDSSFRSIMRELPSICFQWYHT